jgi:hypothetical protein
MSSPQGTENNSPPPATTSAQAGPAAPPPDSRNPVLAHRREIVSAIIELVGIGVLSAGFWLIRPWCGLIVLGAGLIVLGIASSPRFDRRRPPQ